jgi:hypothetical protein
MHYLVVRTEVRQLTPEELAAAWAKGVPARDERLSPECRRQTAFAHNLESALHLARALATVGAVRAGRQRVKVIRLAPVRARRGMPSPYRRGRPSPYRPAASASSA